MHCLVINGSPHKGNTWSLVQIAKDTMRSMGSVTFEDIHLGNENIPFCTSCLRCFLTDEECCPHKAAAAIAQKIQNADALIITSPVYSLAPSALVKNFIDHMSYKFHRPSYFDKKALVISTTVGAGTGKVTRYIRDTLKHWGMNRVYRIGVSTAVEKDYRPTEKIQNKVQKTTSRFYRGVVGGKLHPPTLKRVLFYNVWRGIAKQNENKDNCDSRYWIQTGLIDATYAPSIRPPLFKRLFGSLIYFIIAKLVKF